MTLIKETFDDFIEDQIERVAKEIQHWEDFKAEHQEGAYYAFSEQHRDGNIYRPGNEFKPEHEENLRQYVELPDVQEIDNILVDMTALQIPYNCMWKSCRLTGKYCCKVTSCTANTNFSESIMQEAGRFAIDKYEDAERIERIKSGDTHTPKLSHNSRIDGHCVFGEERQEEDPETGDEHTHIHCNLHEEAYERNVPMHWLHSIGPSLFPADINILDGQWFLTAAHPRAKEEYVTRWYVTSDETICVNHGDTKPFGILQHPDFHDLFADVLGEHRLESIQEEIYGESGSIEPDIQDGWIRAEERGLEEYEDECRNCEGSGCSKCDGRGVFVNWKST